MAIVFTKQEDGTYVSSMTLDEVEVWMGKAAREAREKREALELSGPELYKEAFRLLKMFPANVVVKAEDQGDEYKLVLVLSQGSTVEFGWPKERF